jgi:hypothetical protein
VLRKHRGEHSRDNVAKLKLSIALTCDPFHPRTALSQSYSTRIAEVEDPDKPNEHELPVGHDHGYVWRLDNYWRIEEKDGGAYVQVESVGA